MPLKPSLRAICHYRALSAFTVYNRGGGRNSSVLSGFFWPSVGLLARTAGKSLKPWLLVNEGGLSTVPCCWFAIRIATRDSSRFVYVQLGELGSHKLAFINGCSSFLSHGPGHFFGGPVGNGTSGRLSVLWKAATNHFPPCFCRTCVSIPFRGCPGVPSGLFCPTIDQRTCTTAISEVRNLI